MLNIITKIINKSNITINLIAVMFFFQIQGFTSLSEMSLEEKIGQLFVIPVCELREEAHLEEVKKIIFNGRAGGILLKQGTVQGQIALLQKLKGFANIPLLCLQDGEWGVAMRLADAPSLPKNLTLGAISDLPLLYEFGRELGRQCRAVGAHINLAPVVDVNSNPLNPIIHMRSFGEDPLAVSLRAELVMRGIQSEGVFACAKHFPGHGDTSVDSHVSLPIVNRTLQQLEQVEFVPFRRLIQNGVKCVMTAHLEVNALSKEPATFSSGIVTELLQNDMGFQGLIISDALNMRAVAGSYSPGEIAVKALIAGHDLLLYGDHIAPNIDRILGVDLPEAFDAVKAAVEKGDISVEQIDHRVRKILEAKRELGLFEVPQETSLKESDFTFNFPLKRRLFEEAITLLRNEKGIIPLKQSNVALVEWGEAPFFKTQLKKDLNVETFSLEDSELFSCLNPFSCIILALSQLKNTPPHFGLNPEKVKMFQRLAEGPVPVIAVVFGTAYSLAKLPLFSGLLVAYEIEKEAQECAAEVILGRILPKGKLPVSTYNLGFYR